MKPLNSVMIIDDDKMSQLLYKRIVEVSGVHDVISFLNAEDALKYISDKNLAKEKLPGLIFLDINMPGMDGWDYLDEFKKLDDSVKNEMKIAILSSSIAPEDKIKAGHYKEVIDYVEKPLTSERTHEIIEKYF